MRFGFMRCLPQSRHRRGARLSKSQKPGRLHWRDESGEATIEFVAVVLGLLVPLVYLLVVFSQIQAGIYAAEAGAAASVRILTEHPHTGMPAAQLATKLAVADQGLPVEGVSFSLRCETTTCPDAGSRGVVEVNLKVPLPVVGALAAGMFPSDINLSCVHPIQWGEHGA